MRVNEVDLPGVGRKFTVLTDAGDELVIVVHHSGRRQMLYYEGGEDDPAAALELTDDEARELGAILSGVLFHPEHTGSAATRFADQAIEWVEVPAGSPAGRRLDDVTGASDARIIGISRGGTMLPQSTGETWLEAGDTLVLAGSRSGVDELKHKLGL